MKNSFSKVLKGVGLSTKDLTYMHASVYEDNTEALILAELCLMLFSPRSNYYVVNTVWFREDNTKVGVRIYNSDAAK